MNNFEFFLNKIESSIEDTYDNFFFFLLIENILPFEAKYVSVIQRKNFSLVRSIVVHSIEIFSSKYCGKQVKYQEFIKNYFIQFYNEYLIIPKKEYILTLIEKNGDLIEKYLEEDEDFKIKMSTCLKSETMIDEDKVEYLIDIIENKLGISNSLIQNNQILIPDVKIHIDSELYKRDIRFLIDRLKEFIILFLILEEYLKENNSSFLIFLENNYVKPLDKIENMEYLYLVVIHEFLNFLAHYSIGVTFFCSPDNFISNINKATSHLKRAIMDLLDGMIVEYNCSHLPKYLEIRTLKLASLGNKNKIGDLIIKLQNLFKECVCKNNHSLQKYCNELEKLRKATMKNENAK